VSSNGFHTSSTGLHLSLHTELDNDSEIFTERLNWAGHRIHIGEIMDIDNPLRDTYVATLQHSLVDLPEEATLVGVVRRPTGWFRSMVDENYTSLGPPPSLLDEFKQRHEDFKMQGLCDEGAHNAAWEEIGFDERYRAYLKETTEVQKVISELVDRLHAHEELILICYENTDQKRCHRTLLREYLTAQLYKSVL
jgi:hypothetical protein